MPFTALIPSAGRSSRMGQPKAWLELDGETLLARVVRTSFEAGALAVIVVAGSEDDSDPSLVGRIDVAMQITSPDERRVSVAIGDPEAHTIDSIRSGFAFVGEGHDVLLWPVDAPFADAALVRSMAAALGGQRDKIVVPMVAGKRCHPILLGAAVAEELTTPIADEGAHGVVRRDDSRIVVVEASDPRLGAALNTPQDARAVGITP